MAKRYVVLAMFALAAAGAILAQPREMSVTVKEAQARAGAGYMSKIVGVLPYGARVTVLAQQGAWMRVALPQGGEGWVHSSALTSKRVVLQAGSANVQQTASSSEVALAGKGFNKELEEKYREEKKLDYSWVDRMEQMKVDPERVAAFLREGGLNLPGGER